MADQTSTNQAPETGQETAPETKAAPAAPSAPAKPPKPSKQSKASKQDEAPAVDSTQWNVVGGGFNIVVECNDRATAVAIASQYTGLKESDMVLTKPKAKHVGGVFYPDGKGGYERR